MNETGRMRSKDRRLNRTERLFALVLLLQNRPSMTSADLAEHFEVSRRTIFRDIRALTESGVPLAYGQEAGYEILEGHTLPPLMLTARQAATVLVGAEFMKLQSDAALRREATDVSHKIRSVLPSNVRDYIDRLNERTVLDPYWLHKRRPASNQYWFTISEAVTKQRVVLMTYFVPGRKEVTKRTVHPLGLVYYEDHWTMIAFDRLRADLRRFRLENIRYLFMLSERFTPPDGFTIEGYHKEKGQDPRRERVVMRFTAEIYGSAHRHIPAQIEEERKHEKHVDVVFHFENMRYLARRMLRFGNDMQVVEPESLRRLVCEEATALAESHGRDLSGGH